MLKKYGKIILLWLLYSLALGYPSIQRYRALHSHIWDMGVFQNGLWNYSLGGTDILVFSHHFSPILGLYAFLYKIMPYGETLLILQSLSISIAVFPLYAYASEILSREKAFTVVILYCLFSPVWLINLTNFHPDSLIIPLGLSTMYFQKKGRIVPFALSLILLLTIKEISFFIASLICLYGALRYKRGVRYYVLSVVIFLSGLFVVDFLMSAVQGHVLMKIGGVAWLGQDVGSLFKAVLTNPLEVARKFLNYSKIVYMVILFGSFLFLPLLAPLELLPALPGISLAILSDLWRIQVPAYHYPATVVPFIFVSFVEALGKRSYLQEKFFKVLIGVFLLLNTTYLAFFLCYKNDSYHYSRYIVTSRDVRNGTALKTFIPTDQSISVSSSNLVNHAILANRAHYLTFPSGVAASDSSPVLADYVVYDKKRVMELIDFVRRRGEQSPSEPLVEYERSQKALEAAFACFETIYEYDGFFILKRKKGACPF
jgi:uncharacterized membrane protein